jgi:hypothetical protein
MEVWSPKAFDLLGPAFIEFDRQGGRFRFIAVEGWMSCRHLVRGGRPYVEFTWDGNDECDRASGRGWAKLRTDGFLSGRIFIHNGDDSSFKAEPFENDERSSAKVGPRTKPARNE